MTQTSIAQRSESFLSHLSLIDEESEYPMDDRGLFSDLMYEEQTKLAERELASFLSAVTELYGREQAELSAKDWLDESDSMDTPPFSTERAWRAVTIAASARLAKRLLVRQCQEQSALPFHPGEIHPGEK